MKCIIIVPIQLFDSFEFLVVGQTSEVILLSPNIK